MDLKQYIIDKSKGLNIDIIGFTDCEPLFHLKEYLAMRKKENKETEFEEKDIEKRIDPKATFPDCKTIIVIGLSYNNDFNQEPKEGLTGKLSKSSWGLDYHMVLEKRMESLIKEIQKIKEFRFKSFVDTGPLIDRELARKAGIGYYGKNCSIINYEYGSFIFIGYILTDLDINIDPILLEEECRECNLCLKSCPTSALESPYIFNPKICISYLTQTKERIPYELRSKMGNNIYGCDVCQKSCPKNKNINRVNHEDFIPKDRKGYINIEEILSISNKQFKEKYGSMAGSWRGRNIWRRNGIIALGNTKDRENLQILKPLLKDPNPMIREYTAWAILNIDYRYGIEVIGDILEYEQNKVVKQEIKRLINYFATKNIQV